LLVEGILETFEPLTHISDEDRDEEEAINTTTTNASRQSWQTQLHYTVMLLDEMLRDKKELAEKHFEVSDDYDRAIASWETARQDIGHFAGLWTAKTRKWNSD